MRWLLAVCSVCALGSRAVAEKTLELNGASAYVGLDGVPARLPGASFTMAMWVFPTPGLSYGQGTVFSLNTAQGGTLLSVRLNRKTNKYSVVTAGAQYKYSTKSVPQHEWHWVAVTLADGKALKVHVGFPGSTAGSEVLSMTDAKLPATVMQTATRMSVGATWSKGAANAKELKGKDWLCASVDELRIWDTAQTSTELNFYMRSVIGDATGKDQIHLVGYYPFNEGQGEEATADLSSSKGTGNLHNTRWLNTFTPYDTLPEVTDSGDNAVQLDGKRAYVMADSVSKSLTGTAMSVFAWVAADPPDTSTGAGGGERCVVAFNRANGENQNMLCWDPGMKMFFYKDGDNKAYMGGQLCGKSQVDAWHYVGFTIDGDDNGVLYIDAEPKATFKTKVRPQADSRFSIGQEWDGNQFTNLRDSNHFKGAIDEVAVFDRVVTGDEVRQFMGVLHISVEKQEGLVGFWPFDEGTSTQSADRSGFTHTAVLRQGATWVKGHSTVRGGGMSGGWLGSTLKWAGALVAVTSVLAACYVKRDAVSDLSSSLFPSRQGYSVVPQEDDVGSFLDDDGFN